MKAKPKPPPINAKAETVAKLPMFRAAYRKRRCILPIDAFFALSPAARRQATACLYAFDRLEVDREDLRPLPLQDRKERLAAALHGAPEALRYSEHMDGPQGPAMYAHACRVGLKARVEAAGSGLQGRPVRSLAEDPQSRLREALTVLLILWFMLGPLLVFATLVAADARGGPRLRERVHTEPESGVRYVLVFAAAVTFVGIMASIAVR
jgi:hypothetical protein